MPPPPSTASRRASVRQILAWFVSLGIAGMLWWAFLFREVPPSEPIAPGESRLVFAFEDEPLDVSDRAQPARPEVATGSDASTTFAGFCPDESPGLRRPNLATVVNERSAELVDRARVLRRDDSSDALRRGLIALFGPDPDGDAAVAALRSAPDRRDADFDHAAAAAVILGVRALRRNDLESARRWARTAASEGPEDPAGWMLAALVDRRHRDVVSARDSVWRAFLRAPDEPSIGLAVGRAYADTPSTGRAIEGLDAYLAEYPDDAMAAGLRARLEIRADLQADARSWARDGVTLIAAPSVPDAMATDALARVLDALHRAAILLGTERRSSLTVFVHGARADMLAVTCVQGWARAVFDGVLHLDGDSLGQTRRMASHIDHETLHAQLSAVASRAPVWLHEGLAQHFAEQRSHRTRETWAMMVRNETWIPFASLEGSFQVIDDSDDAGMAYHQSLGMVEMLLARGGPATIREAVTHLRSGGNASTLLEHLGGGRPFTGRDLLETLEASLEE